MKMCVFFKKPSKQVASIKRLFIHLYEKFMQEKEENIMPMKTGKQLQQARQLLTISEEPGPSDSLTRTDPEAQSIKRTTP